MKPITFLYLLTFISFFSCGGSHEKAAPESADETEVPSKNMQVKTEDAEPNVIGKEVNYSADGVEMTGYLAYDANQSGKRPGVIVVHEWWGHNEHTRNVAEKLAKEGYVAFALDMYGDGKKAEHPDDAKVFSGAVMRNFEGAKARFNAALKVLKNNEFTDPDETAAIGYCFGGGVVLNMARQGADLDAVATFHGTIAPIVPAEEGDVKADILVMNGADDPFVSEEAIKSFKQEMKDAKVNFEFINYSDAVHAFTNPAATEKGKEFDLPLAYNEQAAKKSWEKCMLFFKKTLKKE